MGMACIALGEQWHHLCRLDLRCAGSQCGIEPHQWLHCTGNITLACFPIAACFHFPWSRWKQDWWCIGPDQWSGLCMAEHTLLSSIHRHGKCRLHPSVQHLIAADGLSLISRSTLLVHYACWSLLALHPPETAPGNIDTASLVLSLL